ncbi:MAG: hypothetical protein EOP45_14635 [Sphingobacteriaceae bacterium]|nr:MAG: hypothetical protein EOP45_14635 [Sphingobacteriaceae bacterium]
MVTIPVSVVSGERAFSKLKLIKKYLRNSMSEERLNELTIISIENDIAHSIKYDDIIADIANTVRIYFLVFSSGTQQRRRLVRFCTQ